jgi:subtilase family serine protease
MSKCPHPYAPSRSLLLLTVLLFLAAFTYAGESTARITTAIDETDLVELHGSTHPLALAAFDQGRVADSFPMEHMYLVLRRSPAQEAAVEHLIADMHNPKSANYRRWITAEELGEKYGPAREDIETVVRWLTSHGLQVNLVHSAGLTIDVSGSAGQVREAFHTEIHSYNVHGEQHIANSTNPKIPAALAPVIVGFNSLHNFMPKPVIDKPVPNFSFPCTGCPDGFDNEEQFDEAPADFAKIYNVSPLYTKGITGAGQQVFVLEVSDILAQDVKNFRNAFGLSSYSGTFLQIHIGAGCTDPGRNGEEGEAALDAEWAGAIAPDAVVKLASCNSTSTNFGAFIEAQNLLDLKTPPPIMSFSFGACEAQQGPGGNAFLNAMWQQADAEGTSIFVSAGDGSAAGCDNFDTAPYATEGIAVNSLASTTHNFATGGTDFQDTFTGTNALYWSKSNSASGESAKSYIPEMPWNDSCGSSELSQLFGFSSPLAFCNSTTGASFFDIVGGSGGPSFVYDKPVWQAQIYGIPADGKRDLPDVSLFASNGFWNHAVLFCMSDAAQGGTPCQYATAVDAFFNSAGGTSFTAPQFASIQALINQAAGGLQGNAAPGYYLLGRAQYGTPANPNTAALQACNSNDGYNSGAACYFHDVSRGNNDVPCYGTNNCFQPAGDSVGLLSTSDTTLQIAYPAHSGWDFATGLGTPNVANIVSNWP